MSKSEFASRLDEAMMLPSDPNFSGVRWVSELSLGLMTSGPRTSWSEMYQPFLSLLFRIGLVGISPGSSAAPIFYNDNPHYVERESSVERAGFFFIHRTYQAGLDVELASNR